jgi:hypothetical protein
MHNCFVNRQDIKHAVETSSLNNSRTIQLHAEEDAMNLQCTYKDGIMIVMEAILIENSKYKK